MNTNLTNIPFFAIVAIGADGQRSWLNISGVPLDVSAADFEKNRFNIEWVQQLKYAFRFNRLQMAELSWVYCEKFFLQINEFADQLASTTVLIRNHGFVPANIALLQFSIDDAGQQSHGIVLKEIEIAVKSQKAA